MRKILILGLVLGLVIFFTHFSAQAITLEFVPSTQVVIVGNPADVGIKISGLGDLTAPSLGTFDLDITYDPLILSFNSLAFGDTVLGDQLDLFGLGSVTGFDSTTPGLIDLFEISLDDPFDLENLQAGSFILATLTFDTLVLGTSPLTLSNVVLGDAWGDPIIADEVKRGSISAVPEPCTILLLSSGLVGVGLLRKKLRTKKV